MLVDDESDIREGLIEVVPFEKYGFTVVGQASNGVQALQLAEQLKPDLIITDIRMPVMDGLTLCRQVKKILPTTRFIILSGYDDFEYARQAIALNCLGYLLKPISSSEFIQMLENARQKLNQAFEERRDLTQLTQHFKRSLPLLRENLLSTLLSGAIDVQEALRLADCYAITLKAPAYVLAVIRVELASNKNSPFENEELLRFAVMNTVEETLGEHAQTHVFHHHNLIATLILLSDSTEYPQAFEWVEKMQITVNHYLNTELIIGISAPITTLSGLSLAFEQAESALEQCALIEGQQVLSITDVQPETYEEDKPDTQVMRSLGIAIKAGRLDNALELLDTLFKQCKRGKLTPNSYNAFLLELLMLLMRCAGEMNLDISALTKINSVKELFYFPKPPEAQAIFAKQISVITSAMNEKSNSIQKELADRATNYLSNNFSDEDLTVEKLCRELHISPSYFSAVFKKETKKTFVQSLTEFRMDNAMQYLRNTSMKTTEIAQKVGIGDPSYFSYAFKKHFGISPSQARKQGVN